MSETAKPVKGRPWVKFLDLFVTSLGLRLDPAAQGELRPDMVNAVLLGYLLTPDPNVRLEAVNCVLEYVRLRAQEENLRISVPAKPDILAEAPGQFWLFGCLFNVVSLPKGELLWEMVWKKIQPLCGPVTATTLVAKVNPEPVIAASRDNCSNLPVTTARYYIEVVLNEAYPDRTPEEHRKSLADEFQEALDAEAGHFEDIRYNLLMFEVVHRTVLDVAPANEPEQPPANERTFPMDTLAQITAEDLLAQVYMAVDQLGVLADEAKSQVQCIMEAKAAAWKLDLDSGLQRVREAAMKHSLTKTGDA